MKAVAAVILAGAVAVLGTLGARGDWPVEASAGGTAEVAEANGDVAPAVGAALAQVHDEDGAPAWVDVAANQDRGELFAVFAAGTDLRGRRFSSDGTALGVSFAIADVEPRSAVAPRVAYDPSSKRYLVVWARRGGPVEAVVLDTAGAAVSEVFTVLHGGHRPIPAGTW